MEFFVGGELEEPGLVNAVRWRPDPDTGTGTTRVRMLAGVGRKV